MGASLRGICKLNSIKFAIDLVSTTFVMNYYHLRKLGITFVDSRVLRSIMDRVEGVDAATGAEPDSDSDSDWQWAYSVTWRRLEYWYYSDFFDDLRWPDQPYFKSSPLIDALDLVVL